MKKHLLLFLLFTGFLQAQTYPVNPTKFGKISLNTNLETSSTTKINTQDPITGEINYINAVNLPIPTSVINAIKQKADLSTGLIKNGLISINTDPTKFNVSAGIGIISNFDDPENPTSTIISFPAFTGVIPTYLNTGNITYIAVNSTPTIVMQATPFTPIQRRDLIELGAVIHSNLTNINVVNNISAPSNAIGNQLHDLYEFIGPLNLTGNKYSANGANLQLNKSAGTICKFGVNFANDWKNPHQLTQGELTAITFRYRTQNGTEGADVTAINPAVYDLNNVLTAVPNNKFTIQTVVMFQTGLTRILYGQSVYDDLASAKNAVFTRNFNMEVNAKENGIIRAYIIVKNNTTSLQNANDAEIQEAQKYGGIASGGVALTLANIVAALGYTPENVANKQNSLAIDGTGTKYPTVDAVNAALPATYSTVVYVNSTSPNTATIFDDANPPVVNDPLLEDDTANLYIGNDASTWVYNGSTYVTKSVPATSNFFIRGTTTDAGNSKTENIERSGNIKTSGSIESYEVNAGNVIANNFIKSGGTSSQFLKADGSVDATTYEPALGYTPANDSNVVHKTGNELIDGLKSFTNTINIQTNDYAAHGCNILTNEEDSYGINITTNNQYSYGTKITTNGEWAYGSTINTNGYAGIGADIVTMGLSAHGTQINTFGDNSYGNYIENHGSNSTGNRINIFGASSIGMSINLYNDNAEDIIQSSWKSVSRFTVSKEGNITGKSFIKSGGTSSQFLKADGSVDSNAYASLASPGFTGTPTAPTAAPGTTGNQIATVDYVQAAKQNLQSVLEKGNTTTEPFYNILDDGSGQFIKTGIIPSGGAYPFNGVSINFSGQQTDFAFGVNPINSKSVISINKMGIINKRLSFNLPDKINPLFPNANEYTLATLDDFSKKYTVSSLPTPTGSEPVFAIVTDATAPTYLGTLTGGGSVVCPVFYNGTAWVAH